MVDVKSFRCIATLSAIFLCAFVRPEESVGQDAKRSSAVFYIAQVRIDEADAATIESRANRINNVARELALKYDLNLVYVFDVVYYGFAFTVPGGKARDMTKDIGDTLVAAPSEALNSLRLADNDGSVISTSDWARFYVHPRDGRNKNALVWIIDSGLSQSKDFLVKEDLSGSFLESENMAPTLTVVPKPGYGDRYGHGTAVASLIGSTGETSKFKGFAFGVPLAILRVARNDGSINVCDGIAALNYVGKKCVGITNDVVKIANLSLDSRLDGNFDKAVLDLCALGVKAVIASGNDGGDSSLYSPARIEHPNAFVVAAVDRSLVLWPSSNIGRSVKFAEPGVLVACLDRTDKVQYLSGTSLSAAIFSALLVFGESEKIEQVGNSAAEIWLSK